MAPLFMFLCFLATTLIGRGICSEPSVTMFRPQSSSGDNGRDSLISEMEDELKENLKKLEDLKKQEIKNQDDAKAERTWYDFEAGQNRLDEYERKMTEYRANGKRLQEIRRQEIENNKNLGEAQRIARAGKLTSLEIIEDQEEVAYENLKSVHTLKKQESKNLENIPLEYKKTMDDLDRRRYENNQNRERLGKKMESESFQELSEAEKDEIRNEHYQTLDISEQLGLDGKDAMNNLGPRLDHSAQKLRGFEKLETEALEMIKRTQILKKQEIDSLINLAKP